MASPNETLPIGHLISGRYRVDAHLGLGGYGKVYQVWDVLQQTEAALKLLKAAPPGGWYIEAELLTGLRGDYVLPILNADHEAGVPFIVTAVMSNGCVEDHIPQGIGVDVDRASTWIQQAATGVSRIHDRQLLHNDIKAANLFLDDLDRVLVGDLGLACKWDINGEGHPAGSFETMAPEVASGQATTVRSDVYSLGATLYHLFAGDFLIPALRAQTDRGTARSMVASNSPVPLGEVAPHVPAGLRNIVMKAISVNPSDRYNSAAELAAALGARRLPPRTWTRVSPCAGHTACFTGTKAGATSLKVCAVPSGAAGRHVIESRRDPSGVRVNPWREVARRQVPTALRSRIAALT